MESYHVQVGIGISIPRGRQDLWKLLVTNKCVMLSWKKFNAFNTELVVCACCVGSKLQGSSIENNGCSNFCDATTEPSGAFIGYQR